MIFGAELRGMASRRAGSGSIERHTDTDGLLDPAELDGLVPDWAERQTWACGPTGLLDALEEHWEAPACLTGCTPSGSARTSWSTGEGGAVTFARSGTVVEADGATPLLDAGEAAGVLMPSGCRMGICFGCVVPLPSPARCATCAPAPSPRPSPATA